MSSSSFPVTTFDAEADYQLDRVLAELDEILEPPPPPEPEIRLLRVDLDPHSSALLPLTQVRGVVSLRRQDVLPVPDMAACVLGAYNWRGSIIWLVDLSHLLGFMPLDPTQVDSLMAVVVEYEEHALGVAVLQVGEIEAYGLQQLLPPLFNWISPHLRPFVQGHLRESSDLVLRVKALIDHPMWKKRA